MSAGTITAIKSNGLSLKGKLSGTGALSGAVALAMIFPEIKNIKTAMHNSAAKGESKMAGVLRQLPKSAVNVAKWTAIPALLSCFTPAGLLACATVSIAGLVLPMCINELNETSLDITA